jgi:hypothetical protein
MTRLVKRKFNGRKGMSNAIATTSRAINEDLLPYDFPVPFWNSKFGSW